MAEPRKRDAFELAVAALSSRERTVAELQAWLGDREVSEDEIAEAIERLITIGELDDERYAHRYAEDKRELRGWGPERIRSALVERGVEAALAERAVSGEDSVEQAERAAALLSRRGGDLSDDSAKSRALAYLARRGFDYEIAYRAIRIAASESAGAA